MEKQQQKPSDNNNSGKKAKTKHNVMFAEKSWFATILRVDGMDNACKSMCSVNLAVSFDRVVANFPISYVNIMKPTAIARLRLCIGRSFRLCVALQCFGHKGRKHCANGGG